jgi:tyrosine-protein phosphatase SIW14
MMPRSLAAMLAITAVTLIVAMPLLRSAQHREHVRNFRAAIPGKLYRSGQMSPEGVARVIDEYGIRTLISFRDTKTPGLAAPDEFEEEICRRRGVQYHRYTPLNWSMPDGSIPATENVDRFVTLIHDPKTPWPMLVHCFAGIHRTGTFVAIAKMELLNWSPDEAIAEMLPFARDKRPFEADVLGFLKSYTPRGQRSKSSSS